MPNKLPINGWLNLNKPLGISSAAAVGKVKRILRPDKIGHGGTLDPLASGVLPLAIGEATKTMQFCVDGEKEYEFTVKWGEETTTLDCEGEVIKSSNLRPTKEEIVKVLEQFKGEIWQSPPAYSAIKINGKRAYELARQGIAVDMQMRIVKIHSLEVIENLSSPNAQEDFLNSTKDNPRQDYCSFRVLCGKGTYVRSLAKQIALALGTFAHVVVLCRTKVGKFSIKDAILLENIEKTVYKNAPSGVLLPVDTVLDDIQVLEFTPEEAGRIRSGQKINVENLPRYKNAINDIFVAKCGGVLVAVCAYGEGVIKPIRVFNL